MSDLKLQLILEAQNRTEKALKQLQKGLSGLEKQGRSLKAAMAPLAGLFGAWQLKSLASEALQVARSFDSLKASLVTVTGSQKQADRAFAQLQQFASTTPYQIQEVVQAFIKLKALGLEPSQAALRSYGNTASAMGKSLNQMIEAVADAATGEFERLKEFGIKARVQGDKVRFTFRGVTTEVKNSADAIEGYLRNIGETDFAGGMSRQMETIGGKMSNLADSWDKLLEAFGNTDAARGSIDLLTEAVERLRKAIKPTVQEELASLQSELQHTLEQMTARDQYPEWMRGLWGDLEGKAKRLRAEIARLKKEIGDQTGAPDQPGTGSSPKSSPTPTFSDTQLKKFADAGKGVFGSWEYQARDRYEVKSRALDVAIEQEQEQERLNEDYKRQLWKESTANWEQQLKDREDVQRRHNAMMQKSYDELTQFGIQAARNIQDSFAEFLFNPFEKGVKGMLDAFSDFVRRTLAQIASSFLLRGLFMGMAGSSIGWVSTTGKTALGALGYQAAPVHHGGGVFTPVFHVGGLNANEGFAILERGERVLSVEQNRIFERLAALLDGGGAARPINVTILNQGEAVRASDTRVRSSRQGLDIVVTLEKAMADRLRSRGGSLAQALEATYGLSRTGR